MSIIVSNPTDLYIQIIDIFASIEENSNVRIFWINPSPVISAYEENKVIAKIRALPSKLDQVIVCYSINISLNTIQESF